MTAATPMATRVSTPGPDEVAPEASASAGVLDVKSRPSAAHAANRVFKAITLSLLAPLGDRYRTRDADHDQTQDSRGRKLVGACVIGHRYSEYGPRLERETYGRSQSHPKPLHIHLMSPMSDSQCRDSGTVSSI